MQNILNNQCDQ